MEFNFYRLFEITCNLFYINFKCKKTSFQVSSGGKMKVIKTILILKIVRKFMVFDLIVHFLPYLN